MNMILSVSLDWGIGKDNDLLFHVKEDMAFFRKTTMGKCVVMGRKTLESFPNAKPLPKRDNVVLTRNRDYAPDGVTVCNSVKEVLDYTSKYDTDDVFVIGGAEVYELFMPYCRRIYLTKFKASKPCDRYFANLDERADFKCIMTVPRECDGLEFEFTLYERV